MPTKLTARPVGLLLFHFLLSLAFVSPSNGQEQKEEQMIPVTLDVLEQVTIASQEDGFILESQARPGNFTTAQGVIVEVDARPIDLVIQRTKHELQSLQLTAEDDSQVNETNARRGSAQEYVTELEKLSAEAKSPRIDMVRAKAELKQAEARLSGAKIRLKKSRFASDAKQAELKLLELRKQNMMIASPFAGCVADAFKFKGDFVSKGEPIAIVYRLETLLGVALLRKEVLDPSAALGRSIRVTLNQKDEQTVRIERVAPRVDASNMFRVYFEIQNTQTETGQWKLLPGMTVTGALLPPIEGEVGVKAERLSRVQVKERG